MELYLIRHGIAAEPENYQRDEDRPLVKKGQQKTRQVAQRLYQIGIRFDLILTSPLIRAAQTAEILQEVGLSSQVKEFSALAPGGDIQDWVNWQEQWRDNKNKGNCLALVGHQPNLGDWAEILLWGNFTQRLVVKKASVIGLELPENLNPVANSRLFLLTPPKYFV